MLIDKFLNNFSESLRRDEEVQEKMAIMIKNYNEYIKNKEKKK